MGTQPPALLGPLCSGTVAHLSKCMGSFLLWFCAHCASVRYVMHFELHNINFTMDTGRLQSNGKSLDYSPLPVSSRLCSFALSVAGRESILLLKVPVY